MAGIENNIVYGGGVKLSPSSSRDISDMQRTSVDVSRINHTGSPEGVVSANPSSLSHDPVSGILYVKQSGTGNTGWKSVSIASFTSVTLPAGDYNVLTTDQFIGMSTAGAARLATLPASPFAGETHTIADISANAAINNLTIDGNGNNIMGSVSSSTYVINSNGGSVNLIYTGTVWKVV